MYKLTIVALLLGRIIVLILVGLLCNLKQVYFFSSLVSFITTFAASSKIIPPGGPCDVVCLAVVDPVCGYNGKIYKSFGNDCEMNRENCDKPISMYL